ncbi:Undecaprenyl-phosphate alpha-N-acetylglucosaminyl 1-phosphate transferase [hydrothermal vent metagenome]|uniref:Undecaprenyl-phosphate alpha-N-acetylglucosaminyl 1-phosphate transferase n=1 Tax=hydrothermal vent metagenome TaxID=652676 RepID=A0A3B0SP01_9ZZZZ
MFQAPDAMALLILTFVAGVSAILSHALVNHSIVAKPNQRSAHTTPIPTAGGLALVISITAGLLLLLLFAGMRDNLVLALLGVSSIAAILGLVDDAREIPAKIKFGGIGVLSIFIAIIFGPVTSIPFDQLNLHLPWIIGVVGTALWAFTLINSINFVDGADGVIPLSTLLACLGLAALAAFFGVWSVCWSGLLLAAALAGFLPFNMPRAKIFLGDTGSLFIGTWFASSALLLIARGPDHVLWLMPLLAMPWLSDVLLTMAWRLRHKQDLLTPHKDHLYQWAMAKRAAHFPVAIGMSVQTLVVGLLAIVFRSSATSAFLAFAAAASFAILVHIRVRGQAKAATATETAKAKTGE